MSAADDRDLERYLRGGDALSRAYADLKSERPSPALDQAVLVRARDALQGAPRRGTASYRRWTAVTALAATVLLSFGLVMRLALERDARVPAGRAIDELAPLPAASAPERSAPAREMSDAALTKKEAAGTFATTPNASPAPSSIEEQRPAIEQEIRDAAEQVPVVPEPVPPAAVQRQAPVAGAVPSSTSDDLRREPSLLSPDAAKSASGAAAEQDAASAMKPRQPAAGLSRSDTSDTKGNRNFAPTPERALVGEEEFTRSPEAWLAEIERLRAAGDFEAADRELARFRKAYPEYLEKLKPHEAQPR